MLLHFTYICTCTHILLGMNHTHFRIKLGIYFGKGGCLVGSDFWRRWQHIGHGHVWNNQNLTKNKKYNTTQNLWMIYAEQNVWNVYISIHFIYMKWDSVIWQPFPSFQLKYFEVNVVRIGLCQLFVILPLFSLIVSKIQDGSSSRIVMPKYYSCLHPSGKGRIDNTVSFFSKEERNLEFLGIVSPSQRWNESWRYITAFQAPFKKSFFCKSCNTCYFGTVFIVFTLRNSFFPLSKITDGWKG